MNSQQSDTQKRAEQASQDNAPIYSEDYVQGLKQTIENRTADTIRLRRDLAHAEYCIDILEHDIADFEAHITQQNKQLDQGRIQLANAHSWLEDRSQDITHMLEVHASLEETVAKQKQDLLKSHERIMAKGTDIAQLTSKRDDLKRQVNRLQETMSTNSKAHHKTAAELTELRRDIMPLEAAKNADLLSLQAENLDLTHHVTKLEATLDYIAQNLETGWNIVRMHRTEQ